MSNTKIEWAENVWNCVTGCTPIAAGCKNCYAKRMAQRLRGRFGYPADDPFRVTLHPDRLNEPLKWKKPRKVFVCSMGDLFHKDVPDAFISDVITALWIAGTHQYIILTKRPQRLSKYIIDQHFTNPIKQNLLLGFSASTQPEFNEGWKHMAPLADAGWQVIVSLEPMLEFVDMRDALPPESLTGLDGVGCVGELGQGEWLSLVIGGGESGPGARPMPPNAPRAIRDQCVAAGLPFFFKQWGGRNKKETGRLLDGREWNEWPEQKGGR